MFLLASCATERVGFRSVSTNREDYVLSVKEAQHLVEISKEKSYEMPSGLNREERRAWAARNRT
ncbi:Uncharacterised protein [Serratia quinivorans]|nr:Uncharacterised protein [Serratia quinivorans]